MALGFFSTEDTLTPQTIERRRKLAEALQTKASDTSPIGHWTQGAARVLDGLVGGMEDRRLNDAEKANQTYSASKLAEAIAAFGGGASDTPASSSSPSSGSPVSLPGATASTPQGAVMPPEQIKQVIDQNVPEADRDYYYRLAQKESSFNPNAVSPTGAAGLVQFTKGTGRQYGLVGPDGDIRKDPVANIQAGVRFTEDNRNTLRQALGREPTYGELALAHQQGAGGAISLLRGGSVPSQNLAVNGAGGLTGQAAANKIQAYYNMPGGQRPYQTASLTPMAVPAVDRMTPEQAAGIGTINPVQRGTISPDGMQMPLVSGESPSAMPAVASAAPTAPMPNAAGGVAPGTMMPMGVPQPRLPAGPGGGPMAYAASGAPVQTDDKGNAIQTPATAAPGQKAIVAALRTPAVPSPSGEGAPAAAPVQMAQAPTQGTPAPATAPQAAPAAVAQAGGNSRRLALAAAIMSDPRVDAGTKQVAASLLAQALTPKNPMIIPEGASIYDQTTRQMIQPGGPKQTDQQRNYNFYVDQERAAGRMPASFNDFQIAQRKAGATNVSVDTKGDNKFAEVASTAIAKRFEGLISEGDSAQQDKALLSQLQDLGAVINTGGAAGIQKWLSDRGIKVGENVGAVEAYGAIIDKLTPQQRIPGSGATSDYEGRMFKNSLPSLMNTPQGNEILSGTLQALAQHKIDRAIIAEQALNREITPQEATKRLRDLPNPYANFVKIKKDNPELFKANPAAPASPPVRGQVPAAGGTGGAPVRVQSPDEARRLPKGTPIILPDGRTGVVP